MNVSHSRGVVNDTVEVEKWEVVSPPSVAVLTPRLPWNMRDLKQVDNRCGRVVSNPSRSVATAERVSRDLCDIVSFAVTRERVAIVGNCRADSNETVNERRLPASDDTAIVLVFHGHVNEGVNCSRR